MAFLIQEENTCGKEINGTKIYSTLLIRFLLWFLTKFLLRIQTGWIVRVAKTLSVSESRPHNSGYTPHHAPGGTVDARPRS